MKLIIGLLIWCVAALIVFLPYAILAKLRRERVQSKTEIEFVVSKYYTRIEKAALDILEAQAPIDQTIILWWGLDGLRLNEDGSLEWINRRRPKPTAQDVSYQPCQSIKPTSTLHTDFCQTQSTRAQIDALMAQNATIISQFQPPMPGYLGYSPYMQSALVSPLQQCCVQYPAQYPSYYYGGCCRLN